MIAEFPPPLNENVIINENGEEKEKEKEKEKQSERIHY